MPHRHGDKWRRRWRELSGGEGRGPPLADRHMSTGFFAFCFSTVLFAVWTVRTRLEIGPHSEPYK